MSLDRDFQTSKIGRTRQADFTDSTAASIELVTFSVDTPFARASFALKCNVKAYVRQGSSAPSDYTLEDVVPVNQYRRIDIETPDERYIYVKTVNAGESGTIKVTSITSIADDWTLPTLALAPSSISAEGDAGDPPAEAGAVAVSKSGGDAEVPVAAPASAIAYTTGSGWLSVVRAGSAFPYTMTVTVDAAALSAGTYDATITVSAAHASNSPTVTVEFVVTSVALLGYVFGGYTVGGEASPTGTTEKYDFALGTFSTGATFSANPYKSSAIGNAQAGYVASFASAYTSVKKYLYATDAISSVATALSAARYYSAGLGVDVKGAFFGGSNSAVSAATCDVLTYADDSIAASSLIYQHSKSSRWGAGHTNTTVAVLRGGSFGSNETASERFTWADYSTVSTTAMDAARIQTCGDGSATKGLTIGGLASGIAKRSLSYNYATEASASNAGLALETFASALGDKTTIIVAGGDAVNTAMSYTIATDATAALVATMSVPRYYAGYASNAHGGLA